MTMVSDTDVEIHYYLDGQWQAMHRGSDFVGQPMWLIIQPADGGLVRRTLPNR